MTKGEDSHSEMAHVRQSDGIDVIFNQNSPASSRSRSRSSSGSRRSSGSGRHRGRGSYRRRYRSSSSSSKSSSNTRSRSHPRCHRPSSRCRCDNHRRYGRGRQSLAQRNRAHSRSSSRSPSPVRHSNNRRYRSRSKSSSRRYRRNVSRFSQSPLRSHSRSGSSGHSVNLNVDDKGELLKAANDNATTIRRAEKLEIPVSVKPNLSEQLVESKQLSPETWVRQNPEKTQSQSSEEEADDFCSPKMSPKRKIISFSVNNSLVKPILAAPSGARVTSRVDSYESRKPYGHWVPVKSGRTFNARKHTLAMSH